jgi:NACalpha-BTF3-like transcription factor
MSDDKTKTGGPDRSRISIAEDYEAQYWADKFGVSKEELKQAVEDSGSDVAEVVKQYLKSR